ncbi:MAG TPA: Hsp20/alpha crystallin family protein [bacterium]|nr:Hsp20/alpha crystallin family protein [bacterium]
MAIMRWRPWSEVSGVQDEVNKIFDDFFNRPTQQGNALFSPPLDIAETENEILVRIELPGVQQSDIDVTVHDGVLTVKGEKKISKEDKNLQWHRVERDYGSFTRSLTLPNTINHESIKASHKDGVLTLTMAKREETKPRQIKIS